MGPLPRGTVAFLFTDIEGSTRLLTRLRGRYADVLEAHRRLLRASFVRHGGHEVHTEGDAFFVAFARASDAIGAAVSAQRALGSHRWPEGVSLRVRMGIHAGEAAVRDDDYVGLDVHRAARICSAAHGGQVLVSSSVRELVADALAPDVGLRDLGEHWLKDLDGPEHLFELVVTGLAAEFPPVQSLKPSGTSALPRPPNQTIGRERDVRAIAERLRRDGVRLLTLTGPGGVGKTRLALAAARVVEADFDDGAQFVSLAALTAANEVPGAVAQALGVVPIAGETPHQTVTRFLAAKHLLLVLDNFEHVLDAAHFVGDIVDACPALTVLATSREALALAVEQRYRVQPLALPADGAAPDAVDRSPAVALFVERARERDPAFTMTPATAAAVAEICRRVDGLPLAIELGAARCGVLSAPEIAQRLDDAVAVLGHGPRDAPARQRTLAATIDWSVQLLDPPERDAFSAFAVFAGGATVEAAEAITGAGLDTLNELVDKNLIVRRHQEATTRLRMLETVRAYAAERFASGAERDVFAERHFRYYLDRARHDGNEQSVWGVSGADRLAAIDADIANLHAALGWAVDRRDAEAALALCVALGPYWLARDRYADGLDWTDRALGVPGADAHAALRGQALCNKASYLWPVGRGAERPAVLDEAQAIAHQLGDAVLLSRVLQIRAWNAAAAGRMELAATLGDEAVHWATAGADDWALAMAAAARALASADVVELRERIESTAALMERLGNVYTLADLLTAGAYAALRHGGDRDARAFVERAMPIARTLDNPYGWMILQGNLALARLLTGDPQAAREAFCEELRLCRRLGVLPLAAEGLIGLAAVAAACNDPDRAARLVGAAAAHGYGSRQDEIEARLDATFLDPARRRHGIGAWDVAARDGAAFTFEEAIAYALDEADAQVSTGMGAHDAPDRP